MGTTPLQIDYTNKDYESFRTMMIDSIPKLTPEWTDTSESDFGIVLIELLAHGLDIISYYQDRLVNEAYLPTAQLRKSVIAICKLVNYTLANATPAKVYEVFTLVQPAPTGGYPIPKGTQVSTEPTETEDPIIFETDSTTTIPAGSYGNEKDANGNYLYQISMTQGETINNEILGSSNGDPDQDFYPTYAPVISDDSFIIQVVNSAGTSQQWSKVDDFLSSQPTDQVYTLFIDENGEATVEFGSGSSGAIPDTGTDNVLCTYRVGGGTFGNVGSGTLTNLVSNLVGISSVNNPSAPYQMGTDMEDLDHAKQMAPIQFRTNGRAVTNQDFSDLILSQFSSSLTTPIIKATTINATSDWDADVYIYCIRSDLAALSSNDITAISNYLNGVKIINNAYTIFTGTLVAPTISLTVTLEDNYVQSSVRNIVTQAILNYVQTTNFDFGQSLTLSSIVNLVKAVDGVADVTIQTPTSNITVNSSSIIQTLQSANLTVNVTGGIAG